MLIAQLMGLHRNPACPVKTVDPRRRAEPEFMWFRIVFADRYLCLMLGLPQGSLDQSTATEAELASDTPIGRLERIHCKLASRVLERNDGNLPEPECFALTLEIDVELQRAANNMSSRWWLPLIWPGWPVARQPTGSMIRYGCLITYSTSTC